MIALSEIGQHAALLLLMPFLAIAIATDLRRRHVSNVLIACMFAGGFGSQVTLAGLSGLLIALGGAVIGLIVLLPFYALGGMGAGDVKLLAAAGTFLGPQGALLAGAFTLGAGGLLAVAVLAWHGFARSARNRLPEAGVRVLRVGGVSTVQLPYSLAIAAGALAAAYNASGDHFSSWVSSW
jgi:prepilin peptidase CpaA